MKLASLVVTKPYQNNEIFNPNSYLNRDNCLYIFSKLKQCCLGKNIDLSTNDINKPDNSDYVIYFDMPQNVNDINPTKSYLVILESDVILKRNWDKNNHQRFKKIFTWSPELVDSKKYFKFNFSQKFPEKFKISSRDRDNFCCLIAGNKFSRHPNELYSERINSIRWFEKYHPDKFDLYGNGWESELFTTPIISKLNRFNTIKTVFKKNFPSYKGSVQTKLSTLSNYKFAICYENAKNIPGYITEKIFDCFLAGVIPVYWGAPDINNYISDDTFIDRRKFSSHEQLYKYLSSMPESEYNSYLRSIEQFINSNGIKPFEADTSANFLVKTILE